MPERGSQAHKGWYSRGYLPHFDQPNLVQGITYRLHDSMPMERRAEWEALLNVRDAAVQRERVEAYLNAGYGSCLLREARIAEIVQGNLLHFDGQRYHLLAWVIMPNHVHVLIQAKEGYSLPNIVHSWKSYTAKRANQLLGRTGPFWHREYFDRYIRNEQHLERAVLYVHANPVKAGLVERAEEWLFSSARWVDALDAAL
jgi:REP element-mobilizing transposase RayT